MSMLLSETQRRLLRMIFERGAESASQALSKWLGEDVRLSVVEVEQVELTAAAEVLGPPEGLVAACGMGLRGALGGQILLAFEDKAGLGLVDALLSQPVGTSTGWGEIEVSAMQETTNIVGCAYLNALASHLPETFFKDREEGEELIPTPPTFLCEFAGSLVEFAIMDQALELDRVLLIQTEFATSRSDLSLNGALLFIPDRTTLASLAAALTELESH
jgi:chemotaxis protein CheC